MVNRTAHMNGTDTSSLCFSYDDRVLASRGGKSELNGTDKSKICFSSYGQLQALNPFFIGGGGRGGGGEVRLRTEK